MGVSLNIIFTLILFIIFYINYTNINYIINNNFVYNNLSKIILLLVLVFRLISINF